MTDVNLPGGNDIYAFGFDRSLNRGVAEGGSAVYDANADTAGQTIAMGSSIGGWSVGPNALSAGTGSIAVGFNLAQTGGDDVRIYAGNDTLSTAPFRVTESGVLTATAANITGTITATTGTIGGWAIGATALTSGSGANSVGLDSGGTNPAIYAGSSTPASAPFRVTQAGAVTASNIAITGGSITTTPISGIPNNSSTDISLLEKTHTMVFSVTDADTVAWTSGTVTLSNGRTFSISSGNTGNMAALTYIYVDPAVSSTVLQTTTTASTAMGANKVLIGCAQNNTVTASYVPYGPGQPLVDGANIGALSIVAGNIAASTITAGKLTVSQLSAIAADLGAITAGTVTGATVRTSSSNPKFNMTSSAFQGINTAGTVTFEVVISGANAGDVTMGSVASGAYAQWDDSAATFNVFSSNPDVNVQTFTASGTWTKPSKGTVATVYLWAAGASGASSNGATSASSGGGGGEFSQKSFALSSLSATVAVTIGTGGAAVSPNTFGNDGTDSTFGSFLTSKAGKGGVEDLSGTNAGGNGGDQVSFGSPYAGVGSATSTKNGMYSGAGGNVVAYSANAGGQSIFGGAGGGAAGTNAASGGTSKSGGNGGAGSVTNGVNATAGTAPGGGGGAFWNNGGTATSGAGARGECTVIVT